MSRSNTMGFFRRLVPFPSPYPKSSLLRPILFRAIPAYSLRQSFRFASKKTHRKSAGSSSTRAAKHPPLKTFFSKFPAFSRNTTNPPEVDFHLLRATKPWPDSSYALHRRAFLDALAEETDSPIHRFFTGHARFLKYDSTSSPHIEFRRLQKTSRWSPKDAEYIDAREKFILAFNTEFNSPLDLFYGEYSDFEYNPRNPPMAELRRLMAQYGWRPKPPNQEEEDEKSRKYRDVRSDFFAAFKEEFERHFGGGEDIRTWKELCETLGVVPMPKDEKTCKEVLSPFMVNIYDLVDHKRTGAAFDFFDSLNSLRRYTIENELIFPKYRAKGGPLQYLLREILCKRRRSVKKQQPGQGDTMRRVTPIYGKGTVIDIKNWANKGTKLDT